MDILDSSSAPATPRSPPFFSRRVQSAKRYYLDLTPPTHNPLAVVCGGYESCAVNYAIRRSDFPHYVVEWVVSGRGRFRSGAAGWAELSGGSLFSYGPRLAHEIETEAAQPLAKHFVCFAGNDALPLLKAAKLAPGVVAKAPSGGHIAYAFEGMQADGMAGSPLADRLCSVQLRYLLLKIAASDSAPTADASPAYATYLRCDEFLTANATRIVSLSQLCRECGVGAEHLCRLYRRFGQQPPYQRLTRLKMNAAAQRLSSEGVTIKQVAAELGYRDPFHFSRCFKRVMGLPPSEFRRLHGS